ncbi:MAG: hypothetical protein GY719_15875 [bacterium]|nr:hypothetical protein [bacterium]
MATDKLTRLKNDVRMTSRLGTIVMVALLMIAGAATAEDGRKVLAKGAESFGPVTPIRTVAMRDVAAARAWQPGDAMKEIPRRFYPVPGSENRGPAHEGFPDTLGERQLMETDNRAPTITMDLNFDGQGFSGATPPDTVGDVGPDHYVQAVNASLIAIYDKAGTMEPGFPIALDSLAPSGACTSGGGDPIVLYDWLADRWFLQEFTGGGVLCLYISTSADPTGTYDFYSFTPPSFPDYPHYGVWPDAYYAATNEAGGGGNQTTYAFDRTEMLAGNPATMQRPTVAPPVSGHGFQPLTPADHDGAAAPPAGAPGIFMRHNDDEAHSGAPTPATDFLEMWEMDVDFATPANTTVTALPNVTITDFNSWMINYSTFFSVPQPGSGTLLDAIREAILQRLVYRNFGSHETLLGVIAANRNPATSGSAVEQGNRWFELRRTPAEGGSWTLHDEGTFGGDTNSADAQFFMGSVAMDGGGNIALGYSKTDVGGSPVNPSVGITGRLSTDPAGTMAPENDIVLGGGPSSSGRWGDYANMSVDPADDCTFWFTQEYIPVSGSWGTRIASFVFEECLFGFFMTPTPQTLDVCALTDPDPEVDIDITSVGGWSFTVGLAASGEPPSTTGSFSPNNMLPDFISTYTLTGTGGSTTGTYLIDITGTGSDAPPTERTSQVVLNLAVADPAAPALTDPADGAPGVSLVPTLTWAAAADATSYDVEVADDPAFSNIVYTATGIGGTSHVVGTALDPSTTYYWRVTSNNVCNTALSGELSFTTVLLTCQTFDSTDVPVLIPEAVGQTSGPADSTLTVGAADGGTIADVNVLNLIGTHTWFNDLDFNVESPATTSVQIMNQQCGNVDDFDLNLDDEAAPGAWPCPPTDGGTYQPANPLSAFIGEDSAGTWTLTINDNAGQDAGQLDSWSLEICVEDDGGIFSDGFESNDTTGWSNQQP